MKDGLTINHLMTAQMTARTQMRPIELVDDQTHTIVTVSGEGGLVMRPDDLWLYRKAEW